MQKTEFGLAIKELQELDERLINAGALGMNRALIHVVSVVQTRHLSGPRPLKLGSRSGRLRGSVTHKIRKTKNNVTGKIGSNVVYAQYHELGFRGVQHVRAHTRVTSLRDAKGNVLERKAFKEADGTIIGYKSNKDSARRLRRGSADVQFIKAHTRKVNYKGRPYLRPGLVNNLNRITIIITEEMDKESTIRGSHG